MEKTTRSLNEKLDSLQKDSIQLTEILQCKNGKFEDCIKYKNFLAKLEKKKEFEIRVISSEDKLAKLKKELDMKNAQLQRYSKKSKVDSESKIFLQIDSSKKELLTKKILIEKEFENKCNDFVKLTQTELSTKVIIFLIFFFNNFIDDVKFYI